MSKNIITSEAIKGLRKKLGMSQQDFASALGVGVATVSRWENGSAKPTGTASVILKSLIIGGAGILSVASLLTMPAVLGSGYAIYRLLREVFKNYEEK